MIRIYKELQFFYLQIEQGEQKSKPEIIF